MQSSCLQSSLHKPYTSPNTVSTTQIAVHERETLKMLYTLIFLFSYNRTDNLQTDNIHIEKRPPCTTGINRILHPHI